jgi:hypothetical protein
MKLYHAFRPAATSPPRFFRFVTQTPILIETEASFTEQVRPSMAKLGHLPGIAQKLPSAGLHLLDYQRTQACLARASAPAPALFIMHKGA